MRNLTRADWLDIQRSVAKDSLARYARMVWPILEPETELKWGWGLDAICQHLEALTRGYLPHPRLLITVPPGMMKSLLTSVIWPTWQWGPMGMPHRRIIRTSHTATLAERDSIKAKALLTSEWFQERWPINFSKLRDDWIENTDTGFQRSMAFTKMTGARGDDVILDDPIAAEDANSDAEIYRAARTFRETLPTRVNDYETAGIVVIMQRLNERDVAGVIQDEGLPYTHLMLPMRFEKKRRCVTYWERGDRRGVLFRDPRTYEGELLFPERFPEEAVQELEKALGTYAVAGQLQQAPAPRTGGIFDRTKVKEVGAIPNASVAVRAYDLASSTEPNSPWTVGLKMHKDGHSNFYISNVRRIQGTPGQVKALVKDAARDDGHHVYIDLPQDPGQAGKAQVVDFVTELQGFPVSYSPESGDKVTRALPLASQVEVGNVYVVRTGDPDKDAWIAPFLDELGTFPNSKWKDQVDAASRAYHKLLTVQAYNLEGAL